MSKICRKCGYEADDNAKFCIRCGAHFSEDSEDKAEAETERAAGGTQEKAPDENLSGQDFPRLGTRTRQKSGRSGRGTAAVGTVRRPIRIPPTENFLRRIMNPAAENRLRRRKKSALRSEGRYCLRWRSWDFCSTLSAVSVF